MAFTCIRGAHLLGLLFIAFHHQSSCVSVTPGSRLVELSSEHHNMILGIDLGHEKNEILLLARRCFCCFYRFLSLLLLLLFLLLRARCDLFRFFQLIEIEVESKLNSSARNAEEARERIPFTGRPNDMWDSCLRRSLVMIDFDSRKLMRSSYHFNEGVMRKNV